MRTILAALLALTVSSAVQARHAVHVPEHATAEGEHGWSCDSGYLRHNTVCVSLAKATDTEIRQAIIRESIDSYSGNCPCPYNTDRRGYSCGRRSAHSRPGGESPQCYAKDVTRAEVAEFRKRQQP